MASPDSGADGNRPWREADGSLRPKPPTTYAVGAAIVSLRLHRAGEMESFAMSKPIVGV